MEALENRDTFAVCNADALWGECEIKNLKGSTEYIFYQPIEIGEAGEHGLYLEWRQGRGWG